MPMRKAFYTSIALHVGVLLVAWIGLPGGEPLPVDLVETIEVEIALETMTTERRAPSPKAELEEPEIPPPPPPPPQAADPEPPAPQPEETEVAEPEPAPVPEPDPPPPPKEVAEPEPAPVPVPSDEPKEEQVAMLPAVPRPRPSTLKKKNDFDSVLKTVELLESDTPERKPERQTEQQDFLDNLDLDNIATDEPEPQPKTQLAALLGNRLTVSEEDAVRRQIEKCWSVPVGARNPEELVVRIRVWMNPDRTVNRVAVVDADRMGADRYFRTMAESARRAVLNPRCSPLNLPPNKYDQWRVFEFNFDPSKMVGR